MYFILISSEQYPADVFKIFKLVCFLMGCGWSGVWMGIGIRLTICGLSDFKEITHYQNFCRIHTMLVLITLRVAKRWDEMVHMEDLSWKTYLYLTCPGPLLFVLSFRSWLRRWWNRRTEINNEILHHILLDGKCLFPLLHFVLECVWSTWTVLFAGPRGS